MRDKIYVAGCYTWGISQRKLIKALGDYHSKENVAIYFGRGYTERYTKKVLMLNRHIEHMRDKILMNRMLDKLKIPHPKTYYYPFKDLPNSNERCVIKPKFGSRGKGISFSRFNKIKTESIPPNIYIQHFIPFEKEYRIGIDFNRVLGIREKMGIAKIRNSKSCIYRTVHIDNLHRFAWDIFKKFKVDFCGIDIGMWKDTYITIELNSAPTIGEYWAKKLAEDLIRLLHDKKQQKEWL